MKSTPDADRYARIKLDLKCPKCGSSGLIPLRQLDRMLYCYGCQSRFGVERQGLVELSRDRITVQVRTHSSDWEGHEAIFQSRSTILGNWLSDRGIAFVTQGWGRWALAVAAILFIGGAIMLSGGHAAVKPPLQLPDSLDERAKVFTEALARRKMDVMIRLTDPSQHRALRIWLAHGTGIPQPVEDEAVDLGAKVIRNTPVNGHDGLASLRVEVSASPSKPVALDEQWAHLGEVWYFQPVRLRAPSVAKGSVKAYSKPGKH